MKAVVWAAPPTHELLVARFAATGVETVSSVDALAAATREGDKVAFVDRTTITALRDPAIAAATIRGPVIAICDDTLNTAVDWFAAYPWAAHVMSSQLLTHPIADEHFANVFRTLGPSKPRLLDWVKTSFAGRRIRLTHASRRGPRLERMTEFLASQHVGSRTVEKLRDCAEELLTNVFYDAPVAAGALPGPVSRTQDIALPDDCACDLAYGCGDDLAVVQVRDPFGSLSRSRLIEVLARCSARDMSVQVDETMGGAGLGMWRVFAHATFVAVSVVKNRHTEILVGIAKPGPGAKRPFACHLFFRGQLAAPVLDARERPHDRAVIRR